MLNVINVLAKPKYGLEVEFFYCNKTSEVVDIIFNDKNKLYKFDYVDTINNECKSIIGMPTKYNVIPLRQFCETTSCYNGYPPNIIGKELAQKYTITVDCSEDYDSRVETLYVSTIRGIQLVEKDPSESDPGMSFDQNALFMIVNNEFVDDKNGLKILTDDTINIQFYENNKVQKSIINDIVASDVVNLDITFDKEEKDIHEIKIIDKTYYGGMYILKVYATVLTEGEMPKDVYKYITLYTEPEGGLDPGMSVDPDELRIIMEVNNNTHTPDSVYEVQTDTVYNYTLKFYNITKQLKVKDCTVLGTTLNNYQLSFVDNSVRLEVEPTQIGSYPVYVNVTLDVAGISIERRFVMNLNVSKKEIYLLEINNTPYTETLKVPVNEEVLLNLIIKDDTGKQITELSYDTIVETDKLSVTCDVPHTSPYKLIAKEDGEYEFYFTAYLPVTKHKQVFKIKVIAGTGTPGPVYYAKINGNPIEDGFTAFKDQESELTISFYNAKGAEVSATDCTMNADVKLNPVPSDGSIIHSWKITPSEVGTYPVTFYATINEVAVKFLLSVTVEEKENPEPTPVYTAKINGVEIGEPIVAYKGEETTLTATFFDGEEELFVTECSLALDESLNMVPGDTLDHSWKITPSETGKFDGYLYANISNEAELADEFIIKIDVQEKPVIEDSNTEATE